MPRGTGPRFRVARTRGIEEPAPVACLRMNAIRSGARNAPRRHRRTHPLDARVCAVGARRVCRDETEAAMAGPGHLGGERRHRRAVAEPRAGPRGDGRGLRRHGVGHQPRAAHRRRGAPYWRAGMGDALFSVAGKVACVTGASAGLGPRGARCAGLHRNGGGRAQCRAARPSRAALQGGGGLCRYPRGPRGGPENVLRPGVQGRAQRRLTRSF